MAHIISNVKVYFSKYGINTSSQPKRKVLYVLAAKIDYMDKKLKSKTEYYFQSEITKENIEQYIVCDEFFVIRRKPNLYHFFDSEGKEETVVEINGIPIAAQENNIVIREGDNAIWFDRTGKKVCERPLSQEELKQMS